MMSDKEFAELELRATICPGQCAWPKLQYVHWRKLHEAANEARSRVSEFYTLADQIDCDFTLSREGKESQRRKAAAQAIADFEASRTLARAREAVELAVAKHNTEPKARDATLKALKEAEQGWTRSMDKIGERAGLAKGSITRR